MTVTDKPRALVVGHKDMFRGFGGGVEVCHREYIEAVERAGYECVPLTFVWDRGIMGRLRQKLTPQLSGPAPRALTAAIAEALERTKASFVFYGLFHFPDVAESIRSSHPKVRQVLMSHGAEAMDFLIAQRFWSKLGRPMFGEARSRRMLGEELIREARQRECMDAVLTLSPFEAQFERWLGAAKSLWMPRTVQPCPLSFAPVNGRVGCVARLDHPPNLGGLFSLFDELEKNPIEGLRFRLIGGPASFGRDLAQRYPFVDLLGPLGEEEMQREASTWCCFANPIFVLAKGCSTKLGTALGWGLPIASTDFGARGYHWDTSIAPLASTPSELVELIRERATLDSWERGRAETRRISELSPSMDAVGERLAEFLAGL